MGQIEIYSFLKTQRETGSENYYSAKEIYKGLKVAGISRTHRNCIYTSLIQLERFEYVEVKMRGNLRSFHRTYRLKKKYCKEAIIRKRIIIE